MKKEFGIIIPFFILLVSFAGVVWHEESEIAEDGKALQYNAQMKILYRDSLFQTRKQYDSLVKITEMPNIFNHDGILEESHPIRDITGPPTSISLSIDTPIKGYLSAKDWDTFNKQKTIKH